LRPQGEKLQGLLANHSVSRQPARLPDKTTAPFTKPRFGEAFLCWDFYVKKNSGNNAKSPYSTRNFSDWKNSRGQTPKGFIRNCPVHLSHLITGRKNLPVFPTPDDRFGSCRPVNGPD
jgi:hypothetical protein